MVFVSFYAINIENKGQTESVGSETGGRDFLKKGEGVDGLSLVGTKTSILIGA